MSTWLNVAVHVVWYNFKHTGSMAEALDQHLFYFYAKLWTNFKCLIF